MVDTVDWGALLHLCQCRAESDGLAVRDRDAGYFCSAPLDAAVEQPQCHQSGVQSTRAGQGLFGQVGDIVLRTCTCETAASAGQFQCRHSGTACCAVASRLSRDSSVHCSHCQPLPSTREAGREATRGSSRESGRGDRGGDPGASSACAGRSRPTARQAALQEAFARSVCCLHDRECPRSPLQVRAHLLVVPECVHALFVPPGVRGRHAFTQESSELCAPDVCLHLDDMAGGSCMGQPHRGQLRVLHSDRHLQHYAWCWWSFVLHARPNGHCTWSLAI
mmetsp:Transcript_68271/g.158446  ORF Transcript_68271/g.158446 Transcript_68271/m.158446 type:complete len:278 (-) Transcript_68271:724-1557(-)